MDKNMDYRRTKYCPELSDINAKKKNVERLIKETHPKAQDMHSYLSDNSKKFKIKFLQVYNGKCAYCGVSLDLVQKNQFEIDHFLYGEGIKNTFIRDEQYYICINDEYKKNQCIKEFYNKLRLGSELHRLDYLLMNIIGLQRRYQENEELYAGLGKIVDIIKAKRNIM